MPDRRNSAENGKYRMWYSSKHCAKYFISLIDVSGNWNFYNPLSLGIDNGNKEIAAYNLEFRQFNKEVTDFSY